MNIMEATKEMQKGNEVYRLGWQSMALPMHIWKDADIWWGKSVDVVGGRGTYKVLFRPEDLLADDWEVVKP